MFVNTFAVEGFGEFPVDMLRYDTCWPLGEADAYRIQDPDQRGAKRVVSLRKESKLRVDAERITVRRWASFGWVVLPDYNDDLKYGTRKA